MMNRKTIDLLLVAVLAIGGIVYGGYAIHKKMTEPYDPSGTYTVLFYPKSIVFKCSDGSQTVKEAGYMFKFSITKSGTVYDGRRTDFSSQTEKGMLDNNVSDSNIVCGHSGCAGHIKFVQATRKLHMQEDLFTEIGSGAEVLNDRAPKAALKIKKVATFATGDVRLDGDWGHCEAAESLKTMAPDDAEAKQFYAAILNK